MSRIPGKSSIHRNSCATAAAVYSRARNTSVNHWTLSDIPWDRFDPAKVEPSILRLAKAASLVEQNGADYTRYLCNVFADDAEFRDAVRVWGGEEVQHGAALGRWASLADPSFDYAASCAR